MFSAAHLLFLIPCIQAFYLPGAAPHSYVEGEKVQLYVNALTPMLSGSSDAKLVSIPSEMFNGVWTDVLPRNPL